MSDSVWPHRWQPTRLPRPWDSPGKNTGVGCHFLLHIVHIVNSNYDFHDPFHFVISPITPRASPVGLVAKNPPANARDIKHGFDPWVQKIPLEEGMATHSSILAWKIPWTEEPGGLQCIGSQRVRHDWVTWHAATITTHGTRDRTKLYMSPRTGLSCILNVFKS